MSGAEAQIRRVAASGDYPYSNAVVTDGFVYVAGQVAEDASGDIKGDIRQQTALTMEHVKQALAAAGASLDRAASLMVYLRRADDFAAMNEVYKTLVGAEPPARTTIVADLIDPEALVEISAVGLLPGAPREVVKPASWLPSPNPYSYAIKSGDTLFMAGLVSRSGRDNSIVQGDMTAQAKVVFDNAAAILEAAGMTFADVVSSRVYVTDPALFQTMNESYRTHFPKDPPARATVIAPLMSPAYVLEITMVAVKGGTRTVVTTPAADGSAPRINPNLSSAIDVGRRMYVSGMLGVTDANRSDMKAQTSATLAAIGRTLAAAGYSLANAVDAVVYVTDLSKVPEMNAAWRETFGRNLPARATVRTGLVAEGGLVEVMITAVK